MPQRVFLSVGLALSVLLVSGVPSFSQEGMCGGLFSFLCPSPPPPPPPAVAEPQPETPPPAPKPKHKPKKPHKPAMKQPVAAPAEAAPK